MAYIGKCPSCEVGNHNEHVHSHHTPADPNVVGGGICICHGNCDDEYDEWCRKNFKWGNDE